MESTARISSANPNVASVAVAVAPTQSRVALLLSHTLMDLDVRSQVEETMQDMLVDIELADSLNKEVLHQYELSELERNVQQSNLTVAEQNAIQMRDVQSNRELAESFIKEMWNLSITLGDLQEWKREALPKVTQHESLLQELEQTRELVRKLQQQQSEDRPLVVDGTAESAVEHSPPRPPVEHVHDEQEALVSSNTVMPVVQSVSGDNAESERADADPVASVEEEQETPVPPAPQQVNAVAVTEEEEEMLVALLEEEEPPNLAELEMEVLNRIFEYLDAFEILRTAQCNISLYSRVDSLFGFGGGGGGGQSEVAAVEPQQPQQQQLSESMPASTRTANPPMATIVSVPQTSTTTTQATTQSAQRNSSSPTRILGGGRQVGSGLFSMLQNRAQARPAPPTAAAAASSSSSLADQPALNQSAVNSMADKLTPNELTAIISMTQKLHAREAQVQTLVDEKEVLAGKLQGTERFKEFLSQKVLALEKSLRQYESDQTKVTLQVSSDQEVIAFLDGRVQELERNEMVLVDEKKKLSEELESVQKQNTQKIRVLSDMLQFERQRLAENEKDWKATKKLLVKEVKSCRAQILAAQAERDGFREQNERLKKAVLTNGNSSRDRIDT